ncbi:MAG: TIGR03936 family radical SAM-associated protein [Planctomycetota bacterium]
MFAYSIDGDLRFISHHDTLRLFRRALARADLPVRHSEGFNPHPRLMIPLPRPVGVASCAEVIVVETERPIDPDDALQRLERQTPDGIRMLSARRLASGEHLQPIQVRYRLEATDLPATELNARVQSLIAAQVAIVERVDPKNPKGRPIDVRPFLADLRVVESGVEFTLRVSQDGTAKPAEVAGLLGYEAATINHRIRRLEVQWR